MKMREIDLRHNFSLMFWIKALTEVKVINVVSTLFFIYRGLTLSNIFFTAVVYSVATILTEIPSSYLADKFGRKKIIILSIFFSLSYWILNIFAHTFYQFVWAFILLSFSAALLSGTDEAMVYDTSRELGDEGKTLRHLGRFFSAQRIFKIFVPIIAVLIARNLTNLQFVLILSFDLIANAIALVLSMCLVEPKRYMTLEKIEAGVMKDAVKLFKKNPVLLKIMLNKSILFIAVFMLWRISSEFFVNIGISLLVIGLITSFYQLLIYIVSSKLHELFPNFTVDKKIGVLNLLSTSCLGVFLLNYLTVHNTIVFVACFVIGISTETMRWPLFSELINKFSNSYNRATTISLNNFVKSILDIPLLFLSSYLISINYTYLFVLIFILSAVATVLFPVRVKYLQ